MSETPAPVFPATCAARALFWSGLLLFWFGVWSMVIFGFAHLLGIS